jgi:catechol 2,3-dioxygenase-like lactoylglutathione lyase family enzyme
MRFSHTILYVKNVKDSVAFYEKAFQLKFRFIHESGLYAEMDTGSTTLAFSQYKLIESLKMDFQKSSIKKPPLGSQITFEPDDVDRAYEHACRNGAEAVKPPEVMPWNWKCAYVRDPDGFLIELAKAC